MLCYLAYWSYFAPFGKNKLFFDFFKEFIKNLNSLTKHFFFAKVVGKLMDFFKLVTYFIKQFGY